MVFLEAKFTILIFCSVMMFTNFHPTLYLDLPIVRIENGEILGEEHETYFAFKGIPYAEAERFAPPRRILKRWYQIRKFDKFGEQCAQYNHMEYNFLGSENCLSLNVFVPKSVLKSRDSVPVIVFIHGGAFMFGSSIFYGADIIMQEQNIILVTINYRLGVLGFLSTEDEIIPGNLGLKDQVEALRWVQRNIKAFNGNSNKVTITGFSAGGASAQLHILSSLSNGLFNNAISHSGFALNPWVVMENAKAKAYQVGNYLNCNFHKNHKPNHKMLLQCLKKVPTEKLVMAAKIFQPFLYNPFSPFGVVIEKYNKHPFLTAHPKVILENQKYQKRPYIASITKDEGLYPAAEFYNNETIKEIDENWERLAPFLLDFNSTSNNNELKLEWSRKIRKFYFDDEKITINNFHKLIKLITDRLYKNGFYNSLVLQSSHSSNLYCYHFTYNVTKSFTDDLKESKNYLGIAHGDDIFLIYNNRRLNEYSNDELIIAHDFVEMYRTFSQTNNAVYANQSIKPIKSSSFECINIAAVANNRMIKIENTFGEVDFWKTLNIPE
ncbi:hypothetical protein PVAND_003640 [Polypedilum vanderplanki]|uniref:Carboxylesterase type B domain-containing protein n=1 Tax=Polypedilum vanderplanki TaxID=319348 RepID=A0A9J6BV70_POLVA|nr:hypothetical protein PVAND_003640 [Polypedilum vanderplanki]